MQEMLCITLNFLLNDIIFRYLIIYKFSPCFDEPALKATFKISIEHPSNSIALSNWPGVLKIFIFFIKIRKNIFIFRLKDESSIGNNRKRTSFQPTNKMSTYLVAFVVVPDDFGYVEQKTSSGIPVNNKTIKLVYVYIYIFKFSIQIQDKSLWSKFSS